MTTSRVTGGAMLQFPWFAKSLQQVLRRIPHMHKHKNYYKQQYTVVGYKYRQDTFCNSPYNMYARRTIVQIFGTGW